MVRNNELELGGVGKGFEGVDLDTRPTEDVVHAGGEERIDHNLDCLNLRHCDL